AQPAPHRVIQKTLCLFHRRILADTKKPPVWLRGGFFFHKLVPLEDLVLNVLGTSKRVLGLAFDFLTGTFFTHLVFAGHFADLLFGRTNRLLALTFGSVVTHKRTPPLVTDYVTGRSVMPRSKAPKRVLHAANYGLRKRQESPSFPVNPLLPAGNMNLR